jgi:hypothetical protein
MPDHTLCATPPNHLTHVTHHAPRRRECETYATAVANPEIGNLNFATPEDSAAIEEVCVCVCMWVCATHAHS